MRELREVTKIVNREGGKNWDLSFWRSQSEKRSEKMMLFFEGLANDQIQSKEDAERLVFHEKISDGAFKMFTQRFKERLFDALFMLDLDVPKLSKAYKADFKTNKLICTAKILLASGGRTTAIEIMKKALSMAEEFELNEETITLCNNLRRHYSLVGQKKEARHFKEKHREALKRYTLEVECEEMWYELFVEYATSVSFKPAQKKKALRFLRKADKILEKEQTFQLKLHHFRIKDMVYQIGHEFENALQLGKKARKFCNDNPLLASHYIQGEWALKQLNCCLHLQDYKRGKKFAEDCKKFFPKTSTNRLIFFEYYFLLAMHTERYQEALEIYSEATSHERFKYLPKARWEKWKIFEAYLHFIMETDVSANDEKYNIYQMFNEVPVFSRDKKGFNIAILIVQILFYQAHDNYDMIISRAEALKMYSYRHLTALTPRSRLLIFMILQMESKSFHYENTLKATQKAYNKLCKHQHNYVGRIENMEVVPYEKLWDWIMEKLKARSSQH